MAEINPTSSRTATPSRDRTDELFTRWKEHGDRDAREQLCREFLPLAHRLASKYRHREESFEDLTQTAALGLLGAIDRFDPARGIPFPAFAIPTILGELKRHFRNTAWPAHVPRATKESALRVGDAFQHLSSQSGQSPSPEALAHYLEVDVQEVLAGLQAGASRYSVSLDAPLLSAALEPSTTLHDTMPIDEEGFGLVEAKVSLKEAFARLPYSERRAVELRATSDMRQADIAERLGCSQMQVSRLLRRATAGIQALFDPELPASG